MTDDEPALPPGLAHPRFRTSTIRIEPGGARPFEQSDWEDSLVIIRSGELELEAASGARLTCVGGDILWLSDLALRRLINNGNEPVVITTIRRG